MPAIYKAVFPAILCWAPLGHADTSSNHGGINDRGSACSEIRALVPVPADVSPEMQDVIRRSTYEPLPLHWIPKTEGEWRAQTGRQDERGRESTIALRKMLSVSVSSGLTAGVKTYTVTSTKLSPRNSNRVFVHLHEGGYVAGSGESGLNEAILLAHYTQMKIVSVDYRMPPDHPFPAAVDDGVSVWKEVVRTIKPKNAGLGGNSAGGGLALAVVMKLKQLGLPLPGAIYAGAPQADLTAGGDSIATNKCFDRVGASGDSNTYLLAAARLYAGSHEMRDPLISPVFGSFAQFPPTILVTGTRDLFLSDTVRVHRKLRAAGVQADLHVFEAMSHGDFFTLPNLPESHEAYREIATFLDRHLGSDSRHWKPE